MLLKHLLLAVAGASFGALAAAGVFTVLVAIGLIPRFAGKTHTASRIFFYESCVFCRVPCLIHCGNAGFHSHFCQKGTVKMGNRHSDLYGGIGENGGRAVVLFTRDRINLRKGWKQ